jgi:hypothetical protein
MANLLLSHGWTQMGTDETKKNLCSSQSIGGIRKKEGEGTWMGRMDRMNPDSRRRERRGINSV